jgi:serine/threonine protein kinase/Tol biopolymer transport system component
MSLTPGTRIGAYEVVKPTGAGGMGEVFLARDLRLKRDVALKVLPERYRLDAQRLARFEREAQLLASLNHSNIATLHGLETSGELQVLVMEYIEGDTLSDRLAGGALPVTVAVSIARQLVDALDAAHERGIVHRDLKPSNIKIRPDGVVKVLDFGLARALDKGAAAGADVPTLTADDHVVLGTPGYMSPEQARGIAADRRSDIWAFGCVLYEMLSGRQAFDGATASDAIAAALTKEPDWSALPAGVPAALRRLLRRCLDKDPRQRLRDIADGREHLQDDPPVSVPAVAVPAAPPRSVMRLRLAWLAGAAALAVALGIPAARHLREGSPSELRLQISTPGTVAPLHFALSPDGQYLVFVASATPGAAPRLFLRPLNSLAAQPLPGTDGARYPFWSPDSRAVGFFAAEKLRLVDISGGPPRTLADASLGQGGSWNAEGTILFTPNTVSALSRVPASGGQAVAATRLDSPRHKNHRLPVFLPGGRQFLVHVEGEPEVAGLYLGSLDTAPLKRLTPATSGGAFLPPDRVIFVQDGALVARQLDTTRGELTGDPITLVSANAPGADGPVGFAASTAGIVAYRNGGVSQFRTTWYDRSGKVLQRLGFVNAPEMSPDERSVAGDRTVSGNRDVWIADLVRGGNARLTTHGSVDGFPVWSPDGGRVAFHSQRDGSFDVWMKRVDGGVGSEERLLSTSDNEWPLDWSSDGGFLLYHRTDLNYGSSDLWALPLTGDRREPIAVATSPFAERLGQFSPDGTWVAYETDESGRREIVIQSFPTPKSVVHVSTTGGVAPRWSADGKEIYFLSPEGIMMAVLLRVNAATLVPASPVALFPVGMDPQVFKANYAVTRDGRFLINTLDDAAVSPITLILNWKP